jgi:trimethylamine:corrinoid methyltransferase-like protein
MARPATRDAVRGGEWLRPRLGFHDSAERWEAAGRPELLDEARAVVETTLASHEPLPLDPAVVVELERMEAAARAGSAPPGAPPTGAG